VLFKLCVTSQRYIRYKIFIIFLCRLNECVRIQHPEPMEWIFVTKVLLMQWFTLFHLASHRIILSKTSVVSAYQNDTLPLSNKHIHYWQLMIEAFLSLCSIIHLRRYISLYVSGHLEAQIYKATLEVKIFTCYWSLTKEIDIQYFYKTTCISWYKILVLAYYTNHYVTEASIPAHLSGKDHRLKIAGLTSMMRFALLSSPNCGYEEDSL
jgi:hypothetical protein